MAQISVEGDHLVEHVTGMDRLWSFKSELRIPLADVAGAEHVPQQARKWFESIKTGWVHAPGVHIAGHIAAGTFHTREGRVFWDVRDPEKAVAIQLRNWDYDEIFVQVDDPDATVAAIELPLMGSLPVGLRIRPISSRLGSEVASLAVVPMAITHSGHPIKLKVWLKLAAFRASLHTPNISEYTFALQGSFRQERPIECNY